jgi:uncharacterized delta-60 repeat protein
MKYNLKEILLILIISFSKIASSQSLTLDSLFSSNGFGFQPTFFNNKLLELYKLNDGNYLACGNEHSYLPPPAFGNPITSVIKFTECGRIDSSYGVFGRFENNYEYFEGNIEAIDFFVNDDGSLFIAGETVKAINNNTYRSQVLIKIDSSGSIDPNFILNDISIFFNSFDLNIASSGFTFVEVLSDEKILCAGKFESSNTKGVMLARFNSNGSLDSAFNSIGYVLIPNNSIDFSLSTTHRVAENRILFVGSNQNQELVTLRVNDTGLIDSTYGLNGFYIDTSSTVNGRYSKIDNDKLVIVSKFDNGLSTSEPINIKRFLPDGTPDYSFGNSGTFWLETATNQDCIGFDILEDHRIIFGILYQENLNYLAKTIILNEIGERDSNFTNNGELISNFNNNQTAYSEVLILEDGRWILSGLNYQQRGCIITRYSESNLVPHLTLDGSNLNSGVNSNSVTHSWYLNGTQIPNEHMSTIEFTSNGEYTLTVVDTVSCGEYSDTLIINILKSTEINIDNSTIYPNPCSQYFLINTKFTNQKYSIIDLTGKIIKHGQIDNMQERIDCSDLTEGLYIFKLSLGKSCKLVINR